MLYNLGKAVPGATRKRPPGVAESSTAYTGGPNVSESNRLGADKATSLYRLFGGDDALLYIGIAGNPGRRFEQHAKDKPWWSEVCRVTIEHHPSRTAALLAEAEAIRSEHPQFNHIHNGRVVPLAKGVPMQNALADRDRISMAVEMPATPASLLGSFFHSYKKDEETGRQRVQWQGCVVGEPAPGFYLVETFSWIMGESFDQQLVRIEDMVGWSFYDTVEWMNNAYMARGEAA